MADISKITLPSGSVYNIKDAWARDQIATLTGTAALAFRGVSSTPLTDNGTETPTVSGNVVPLTDLGTGDIYFYQTGEYIWGVDSKWHELGNLSGLGGLAYKNSASTTYTPKGTISIDYRPTGTVAAPTFSGTEAVISVSTSYTPAGGVTLNTTTRNLEITTSATGTKSYQPGGSIDFNNASITPTITTTSAQNGNYTPEGSVSTVAIGINSVGATTDINNPSPEIVASAVVAAAPNATAPNNSITYYDVSNENLSLYQIGYNTKESITTTSVTVKTSDASYKMMANPAFSGTTAQLNVGSFNVPQTASFTGTTVHLYADSFNLPTSASFSGTGATISATTSYTPEGSNTAPGFTGAAITLTTSLVGTTATITVS